MCLKEERKISKGQQNSQIEKQTDTAMAKNEKDKETNNSTHDTT